MLYMPKFRLFFCCYTTAAVVWERGEERCGEKERKRETAIYIHVSKYMNNSFLGYGWSYIAANASWTPSNSCSIQAGQEKKYTGIVSNINVINSVKENYVYGSLKILKYTYFTCKVS